MKTDINYFVSFSGLCFSFDYAERSPRKRNRLCFNRRSIYSHGSFEGICQLDLNVSKLVFNFKFEGTNTYYFDIVPVGGADNGK